MPVNWGIEGYKWQLVLKKHLRISYLKSMRSVLIGIAVSILTPNRNGEFLGRIFSIEEEDKIKATELSFLNSWAQQVFTLLFGSVAFAYFTSNYYSESNWNTFALLFQVLSISFLLLYITIPYWVSFIVFRFQQYTFITKLNALQTVKQKTLIVQLALSATRYIIFTLQYILLLNCFTNQIAFQTAVMLIPIIFLLGSYIPHFALAEFGIKSAVAVYVFQFFITDSTAILQTAFTVWLVNVALPALSGALILLFTKNK